MAPNSSPTVCSQTPRKSSRRLAAKVDSSSKKTCTDVAALSVSVTTTPQKVQSPYKRASKMLNSCAGESLVGRDDECEHIYKLVHNALSTRESAVIYVSGPAGTGKTLTVTTVVDRLQQKHKFKLITVNCMSIENLAVFYDQIVMNFDAPSPKKHRKNCNGSQERNALTKIRDFISQHKDMTVLILDEVDQLKSKNNELLRAMFNLASQTDNKLVLVGISNALDFTSKMVWLKELRTKFHELKFMPYNMQQIVQIIEHRLKSNGENMIIDKSAVEYCARKIASCSGDIRKALDVSRRAVTLLENSCNKSQNNSSKLGSPLKSLDNSQRWAKLQRDFDCLNVNEQNSSAENTNVIVDIKLMMNALNKVYGGVVDKLEQESKVFLPSDQQLILCTLLILLKVKYMREVKLSTCRQVLSKICAQRGISSEGKSETDILTMCQLLADYGYVSIKNGVNIATPSKRTPSKKPIVILLNINPSETEQLLSSFHKSIVASASTFIS